MNSQDDPEARIRDLERPLADRARRSELGVQHPTPDPPPTRPYEAPMPSHAYDLYPPPPPVTGPLPPMPPPAGYGPHFPSYGPSPGPPSTKRGGWLLLAAVVAVGVVASGAIAVWFSHTVSDAGSVIESFDDAPAPIPPIRIDLPPVVVPDITGPDVDTPEPPVGPGDVASVAGVGNNRTLVCAGGDVTISGVDNVVELTGRCGLVSVSGVRNEVHIESVATIGVSGFDNVITYRAGDPEINRSGSGNSVDQG